MHVKAMTDLQTKRLAFLDETVKHFNSRNRAIKTGTSNICQYSPTPTSEGCAIGRHIPNKDLCKLLDKSDVPCVGSREIFNLLPDNLKRLGRNFLSEIQSLHDSTFNWSNEGLSVSGKFAVCRIKKEFGLEIQE